MFNFVRTHQRWLQVVLMVLVLPAFVLTGVATFNGASSSADVVAQLGSKQITQREFAARYQKFIETSRARAGDQFDASVFQKPETQAAFLTQLVNEQLVDDMVAQGRMTASDAEVAQALASMKGMPKNAQGGIDEAAYKALLAQQGMTAAQHQAGVRADIVKAQLNPAYSALNLPVDADFLKQFFGHSRMVEVKSVDLTPYMAQVEVNPAQVQTYFDQNKTQFATPDLFDVEYAIIPVASSGMTGASLTDEDIKAVFGKDATAEQLDKVRKDPTQAKVVLDKVVLKKRAAELDALISKAPQDVAGIAKNYKVTVQQAKGVQRVVDAKSQANTPDVFKDPQVREAILNATQADSKNIAPIMALASGDLLVARVTAYQAAGTRAFDEVKAQIEQELRKQAAVGKASAAVQASLATQSPSASIAPAQVVSWLVNDKITPAIAIKAMTTAANSLPALALVSDKDRVDVIRVVSEQALDAAQMNVIAQWAQSNWAGPAENLAYNAYMSDLRARMGVKMYPERIKLAQ